MSNITKVLFSEKEIQEKVRNIAQQITEHYKTRKELICVCVLKGAVPFMIDLTKHIKRPLKIDYIAVASYEEEKSSSVKLLMDTRLDLENKDVIIIEDIVNSGSTVEYLRELIKSKNPSSIKVCSLLIKKRDNEKATYKTDYYGFFIESSTVVVGYGLDYKEDSRHLPFIGKLCKNDY